MFSETQLYLVYVGVIVLLNVLFALLDWKWGRGIAFTALAVLAGAVSGYVTVLILLGVQKTLSREVGEPQSWTSYGVGLSMIVWYIIEIPIILGLGIGAVLLAALSRRRGWIIVTALALLFTVVAPFLAYFISDTINADIDIVNPRSVHERDVRLVQVHLPFVGVLLAIQLLYLAYGVWRIWRSSRLGSRQL
jgi:predicted membrane-bound dolichyl-phosphate-mannose-protein mannosyltransferase